MARTKEAQKAYRQRQMEAIGVEAFKKREAIARQARRKKNKIPQYTEINKATIEALTEQMKDLVLQMTEKGASGAITIQQKKDKLEKQLIDVSKVLDCAGLKKSLISGGLSAKTVQSYLKKTGRVYELLHDKPWDCKDIEWLKDYNRVIDFILNGDIPTWKTQSTRSTHLNHVSALVMRIPELKDVAPFYDTEKTKKNKVMGDVRLEQELKPEWKKLILPWPELVDKNNTADFNGTYDAAVYALFTLIPPRRSGSYYDLQVKPVGFKSKTKNYITVNVKMEPQELVLNRYKTSKHYGEYRIKLPVALREKLKAHIKKYAYDDYVFVNQKTGKPYTDQRAFNQAVTNVFERYTDKKIGSTILRISYASYIMFGNGKPPSLATQNKHAKMLAHSLPVFQTYARFDVGE